MVYVLPSSAVFCLLFAWKTATANKSIEPKALRHNKNNVNNNKVARLNDRNVQATGCANAVLLGLNETAEGEFVSPEGSWYLVDGTGDALVASTCTDNALLDSNGVDTIVAVYSGDCSALNMLAQDDDGGHCGGLKSSAFFETEIGQTYYVNVVPYGGYFDVNNNDFGVTIMQADQVPTPPDYYYYSCQEEGECCETAAPFAIGDSVPVSMPQGSYWFSLVGTGAYMVVQICTEDDSQADIYGDVFTADCMGYIGNIYGYGTSCATYYLISEADVIYNVGVYGYGYTGDVSFVATVTETTELPNTICNGATEMVLDQVVEGETLVSGESLWYSFVGTGGDLMISTCVGSDLDSSLFDSVIQVYARDCDDLRMISSDDEGGKCGNGKSTVILSSVEGLMYMISVNEYHGAMGTFGLKISAN